MTAPKRAAEISELAVDGYWLDDNLFFFLTERIERWLGRMVAIPSLANAQSGSAHEIISLEALADLLCEPSRQQVDLQALSSAEFDMPDANTLGVSVGGQDYLLDLRRGHVIAARPSLHTPSLYSPDGRYACFVNGHNVGLMERNTGAERLLTVDGATHQCYGQQPETALSAVSYRHRPSPVGLWSADSQWFFTHRIDERSVPDLVLVQHSPPGGGRPALHRYKYPLPGDPLPQATYVAIHIVTGRVVFCDDFPVAVMALSPFSLKWAWFGGRDTVWFVRFDRYFKQAELIRFNLAQGTARIVLSETVASGYIDLHTFFGRTPNVRALTRSDEVIWFSERDGWGHLYLYDASTGTLKNRITSGEWLVRDIVHVDEAQRKLLFLAGGIDPEADPARRSLCSINLDGSGFEVVLTHAGDIDLPAAEPCGFDRPFRPTNARTGISPDGRAGVVRYASVDRGNVTKIVDLQTRLGFTIASTLPESDEILPRTFTAWAADGVTRLHLTMFFPSDFDPSRCYPLIDYIYPGPQIANQPQSFLSLNSAPPRALAELGFITMMLDTRGMPISNRTFHQVGYGALLEPQLADHAAVVRQLCTRFTFIDRERIGLLGQSAGGAAAARALCDYGDIFKVGVAVCGNHDSSFYSAIWSDKYRGPFRRNAFAAQSNCAVAHKVRGHLLLISGDMDENVHVSHTLALVDALVRANRDFDLLIVPNEGHDLLMTNGYAQRRIWDYFVLYLLGETPPEMFEIRFEVHELARVAASFKREARR